MPKTLTYRTADDLHVVDDAGALVLVGFVVRYEGSPFAPGAFARSARERAHKVTAARHVDERVRVPVGRPVTVEDRPEGLWLAFTLAEAVTTEEASAARLAYRVVRSDDRGVITEAAVEHVAIGSDPSRDRTARLNRLLTLTRDSAPASHEGAMSLV